MTLKLSEMSWSGYTFNPSTEGKAGRCLGVDHPPDIADCRLHQSIRRQGKSIWEKGAAVHVMLVWSQGSPLLSRTMEIPEGLPAGLVVLCSFGCALSDWGGGKNYFTESCR